VLSCDFLHCLNLESIDREIEFIGGEANFKDSSVTGVHRNDFTELF
jgi:hypothetical protein